MYKTQNNIGDVGYRLRARIPIRKCREGVGRALN